MNTIFVCIGDEVSCLTVTQTHPESNLQDDALASEIRVNKTMAPLNEVCLFYVC